MVEKKQVVYDLMLKYNGPLSIEEFYREVEKWMKEKGLQKELKKKSESVTPKGKKIEWVIECWKSPVRAIKHMVMLQVLFDNVKEMRIKKKGKSIKTNQADVFINIDGWIEASLTSRWTQGPLHTFFRNLYDKYIWAIGGSEMEPYEGGVTEDCYDLHKRLKAFFELYKMKVK